MPRKDAALAVASSIPNLPAAGSTITETQAIEIARQVSRAQFDHVKAERKAKRDQLADRLGGQIQRVDDSVVNQARQLAARLAAIAQHRKGGRGQYGGQGTDPLEPLVKKIGGIIGELESMMLLDRSIGLFEAPDDADYLRELPHWQRDRATWRDVVGVKARAATEEILGQYKIVKDPQLDKATGKKGAREKNVTPGRARTIAAEVAAEERHGEEAVGE